MSLAFNSKHPFVPNPSKDYRASRWIASLSDGSTVFEDTTPNMPSAWHRLKEYVKLHNLKITNLRLEAYGHLVMLVPYKGPNDISQINGYWHSKKIGALINANITQEFNWRGIGFVKGKEIHITWVDSEGIISHEIKEYKPNDMAVIINDEV
jgi:hypothetical protein